MHVKTPIINRAERGDGPRKLTDPVLVPMAAVAGALLIVLGLGAAVGWMAGRGWSSVPPAVTQPAPVVAEGRCPPPVAALPAQASARMPAGAPAPAPAPAPPIAKVEPAAPVKAAEPHAAARGPRLQIARAAGRSASAGGESWEPARM
jgi:hypothetical protein